MRDLKGITEAICPVFKLYGEGQHLCLTLILIPLCTLPLGGEVLQFVPSHKATGQKSIFGGGKPCVPFLTLGRGGVFSAVFSHFLGQMGLGRSVGMG